MGTIISNGSIPLGRRPPKSWSMAGWAGVAALSVLASYLITLLLALVSLLFGLLLLLAMAKGSPSFLGVLLAVFTLMVAGTILWSLLPRKIPLNILGVPIDLSRETRLSAEIQALAKTLDEKVPEDVYLVPDPNAAVLESGGKRVMMLGIPLLQSLTVSELRAVLAHEFGHYYAGDTRMAPWVFRARMNMAQVLVRLGRDSTLLSFLSRFALIAILRLTILGGLSLWWKLFNKITQHISRKQEYRCDELACYLAGSESLEKGLCSVHRSAGTFAAYWNQIVMPIAASGYRPQLTDGYERFLRAPEIAKAAADALERQLASEATHPMDSHPPLNARVERARKLAIAAVDEDRHPAVTLLEDLPQLEHQLLEKLMPALKPSELKSMQWDSAGLEVYVPVWRAEVAKLAAALESVTVYKLPGALLRLHDFALRSLDTPGTLLTRDQRAERAAEIIGHALALTLLDHGWKLQFQPGQFHLESEKGAKVDPRVAIRELRNGSQSPGKWIESCETNGIEDWQLVSSSH